MLTPEDLAQIRAIMREETAAAEQRLTQKTETAEQRLTAKIEATEQRLTEKQDRAVESIAGEITAIRQELTNRMEHIQGFMDRTAEHLRLLQTGMGSLNRWFEKLDNDQWSLNQKLEDLRKRVEAIERKAS